MNRARRRAGTLRRRFGLHGRVDAEAVANALGLEVWLRDFQVQKEVQIDGNIAVARRLGPEWRRWVTAHAIAHRLMHPGNHVEHSAHTELPRPWEREAEDFAHALLVDEDEALAAGFVYAWEVAEHFGVPPELVRVQARLLPGEFE
ncbi:MAG: ImmA/IrrE family metallo-endopeptidase [Chloroflexi bacterium]|nr:ImmA/IrrE family metallo-endopeptidase [Chloroflexota bacterium]